jgi:3-hydroxybutyryl-CoA dehydrogenase
MNLSQKIVVVGSGYMGGGMAQVMAQAGFKCVLADVSAEASALNLKRLILEAEEFERQGLFTPGSSERISKNLSFAETIEEAVKGAHYIAEAVPETIEIKEEVLTRISAATSLEAIIATNTSAIPIFKLSKFVVNPDRFLGVHWMNPAPFVPGVEIIPSPTTSNYVLESVEKFLAELGKAPFQVSDVTGFVANRLQFALFRESALMVEEGAATPEQIDNVVTNSFGFRLAFFGPFEIADMAGLDVYQGAFKSLSEAYGERFSVPPLLLKMTESGNLGLKKGGGFTKIDSAQKESLVNYRNKAYSSLMALRAAMGPSPKKTLK